MSARKKALLIDDDSAVTDYLQLKLGATFDVVALNDSTQALSVARRERPDVIVCDIDMPAMDGGDVCRALADAAETVMAQTIQYRTYNWADSRKMMSEIGPSRSGAAMTVRRVPGRFFFICTGT